jgi:hypothetical protein
MPVPVDPIFQSGVLEESRGKIFKKKRNSSASTSRLRFQLLSPLGSENRGRSFLTATFQGDVHLEQPQRGVHSTRNNTKETYYHIQRRPTDTYKRDLLTQSDQQDALKSLRLSNTSNFFFMGKWTFFRLLIF